jgi:hypothetical protein
MRRVVACCAVAMASALSGCASAPVADVPMDVGNGAGSQYGNYAAQMDGEVNGPAGEHCVVFNWDRPLTKDLALRQRSASCESQERPGGMVSRELSRTVIPIAQSNLKDARGDASQ